MRHIRLEYKLPDGHLSTHDLQHIATDQFLAIRTALDRIGALRPNSFAYIDNRERNAERETLLGIDMSSANQHYPRGLDFIFELVGVPDYASVPEGTDSSDVDGTFYPLELRLRQHGKTVGADDKRPELIYPIFDDI